MRRVRLVYRLPCASAKLPDAVRHSQAIGASCADCCCSSARHARAPPRRRRADHPRARDSARASRTTWVSVGVGLQQGWSVHDGRNAANALGLRRRDAVRRGARAARRRRRDGRRARRRTARVPLRYSPHQRATWSSTDADARVSQASSAPLHVASGRGAPHGARAGAGATIYSDFTASAVPASAARATEHGRGLRLRASATASATPSRARSSVDVVQDLDHVAAPEDGTAARATTRARASPVTRLVARFGFGALSQLARSHGRIRDEPLHPRSRARRTRGVARRAAAPRRVAAQCRRAVAPTAATARRDGRRHAAARAARDYAARGSRARAFRAAWRYHAGARAGRRRARDGRERRAARERRRASRSCKRGGNAVDAAVAVGLRARRRRIPRRATSAAAATWSSTWPTAAPRRSTIARSRRSPRRATCTSTRTGKLTDKSIVGPLASGVPGAVAGLTAALAKYGTMSLAQVMAPAIRSPSEGFIVDSALARSFAATRSCIAQFAGAALFLPGRHSRSRVGTRAAAAGARDARCARSRDRGARRSTRATDRRRVAERAASATAASSRRRISRATSRCGATPIRSTYRGYTLLTMPPSSSGGVTMTETLNILEGYRLAAAVRQRALGAPRSARRIQRAFIDRNAKLGDPAFVQVPIAQLTDKSYAAQLRATIGADRATPTPTLDDADARRHADDALLRRRREGQRRRDDDDAEQPVRLGRVPHVGGLLPQRRDGRLRRAAGQAEHVRARAGRGERDPAGQAHAERDVADDRARSRRHAAARRRQPRRSAHHHEHDRR